MSGAVLGLFGVSLAAAMSEMLLAGDEKSGVRRAVRVLVSLAVLLLMLRPFLGFLGGAEDLFTGYLPEESEACDFEEVFRESVDRASAAELKSALSRFLKDEFGIAEGDAEIGVFLESDGSLKKVAVTLSGAAILIEPTKVEKAIAAKLSCEVEVR